MPFSEIYRRQVSLLIKTLPYIAAEDCFALKGGTAINLFVRDMPRLSVDIDLTYLPVAPRDESLAAIGAALKRIGQSLVNGLRGGRITETATKLLLRQDGVQVKIEVTPVLRGCVYEPEVRAVSPSVEDTLKFAEIQVVSFADLYAGKIVAALDRQHPRDLFDIRSLLANEAIGGALRRAFLVYLLSHNRPMAEILAPNLQSITSEFQRGFQGMTAEPVSIDDLTAAREALIADVVGRMPEPHRLFLISFERGEPDWALLGVPRAIDLPAVRWRRRNLDTLSSGDRASLAIQLERVLLGTRSAAGIIN